MSCVWNFRRHWMQSTAVICLCNRMRLRIRSNSSGKAKMHSQLKKKKTERRHQRKPFFYEAETNKDS